MCHHEVWPTAVSHLPFPNFSLGLTGGKHYQKIAIPILRLVLQNFALSSCFFSHSVLFSYLSLLSSGWFVIAVYGSISKL